MEDAFEKIKTKIDDFFFEIAVAIILPLLTGLIKIVKNNFSSLYLLSLWELLSMLAWVLAYLLLVAVLLIRLDKIREMRKRRKIYKNLSEYISNTEAIKSIQFYKYTDLPNPYDCKDDQLCLEIQRIGGVTASSFETNCIVCDNCAFSTVFYKKYCCEAFNKVNEIDRRLLSIDSMNYELLQADATDIDKYCKEILSGYLNISTLDKIQTEHYFYYSIFTVLAQKGQYYNQILDMYYNNKPLMPHSEECTWYFGKKRREIEKELRFGKRAQYYGALLTNQSYCFDNKSGSIKKDRHYFSSRFSMPKTHNELLMVVTYDIAKFSTLSKEATTLKCESVRDEIASIATGKKRKQKNAETKCKNR